MSALSTFAARFRELRESAGLKQSEIGEKLGVSRGAISFYENCDRTPDIEFAARAAEFFHVSSDWLLGLSNYKDAETASLTVEDIGLSEQATNTLISLAQSNNQISINKISVLNLMLEDDGSGTQLLQCIEEYISAPETNEQLIQFTNSEVKIINPYPGIAENPPPNCVSAHMLYDKALIDQTIIALRETRVQFRFDPIANEVYEEESENGEPQNND